MVEGRLAFAAAMVAALSAGAVALPHAQTSPAPAFEVATIKRNDSGRDGGTLAPKPGGLLTATNLTLQNLIGIAYRGSTSLMPFQIVGGPDWITSMRFDIVARAAAGTSPDVIAMLRTLLEDRFALKTHLETRQLPIFALMKARSDGSLGPQLRRSAVDCQAIARQARDNPATAPPMPANCGMRFGPGTFSAASITISNLAGTVSGAVLAIVVDRTDLTGNFDVDLTWSAGLPTDSSPSDAPSIFAAVQDQLGLKLESTKGPVEVLVVDHAEQPRAN
jgi:uncharacterized protein (TIGR03435 family)